ncbi:PMS1 protein homolog 1-like [Cataglyphis hispanica]|uniref:PMS1 protein homolog 1-like n=1 Tax=Cataglyphis hispanica TaxID=1086592 RepID=UPI00217F29E2|nr:PMS1 protein homolog 1-like [Cataglyphis hispanica]
MPISALDVKTAKLITTTQIITSVYAVVKELMENAFDANADNVEINLIDNGTSLIEVKDNGHGISKLDAPYIGLSSYTSKISNFEDLDTLQTFGFRGEALNALCAVAEVIVVTKTEEDVVGTSYIMNHTGQIVKHESCHRSTGTTVQVKNLFKQMPVRRQIITNTKKANQVIKLLETLIHCFGICKPNIRIQFRVNNNLVFTKPSLNNIKEAANLILGRKIMSNMEWVEPKDTEFVLQLMLPSKKIQDISKVSHPDLHYIFVNNRPIKHKTLEKLINNVILEYFKQESYRKKMIFLIYIILKPMDIDVNLEPNKDTVLFKDQNKVFDTVDKYIKKYYGLKSVEIVEQNVSNDTSTCYEDYTLDTSQDIIDSEWPICKKRKIDIQEDIIKEKPMLHNNGYEKSLHKQNIDLIQDEQQYRDALAHIQSPNLSDSDSNDVFPIVTLPDKMTKEHETLSQLPVIDLGEDFDFLKEIGSNTSTNENENKLNENEENKQVSLETWSKGHIVGLKGGIDIQSDIVVERQFNDNLDNQINEMENCKLDKMESDRMELDKTHVDNKNLKFIKHVRSQIAKENPTLTAAQTAKKITEFWKQLSSHERGYYRDIAHKEETERQAKKTEERDEVNKMSTEGNKSRLLQLFEKMKNTKNEKKEKLNMRTIVPWTIDRNKIITRLSFESEHIIGCLAPNLWIATICEQIWIIDIIGLIKGLKVPNIDADKIDAKRIECLLKQWLSERDDMSVMHSIYEFTRKM